MSETVLSGWNGNKTSPVKERNRAVRSQKRVWNGRGLRKNRSWAGGWLLKSHWEIYDRSD